MQKIVFSLLAVMTALSLSTAAVLAQEEISEFGQAEEVLTENVTMEKATEVAAEELNVKEPGAFSWFSNLVREVKIRVTRDPVKKSELELEKASYEMVRVRKMVQENTANPGLEAKLEQANNKYQELIGKINARIEEYKVKNPDEPKLKNFLDKYTDQQLKHQEILKNLEEKVPEQVMEKIKVNREQHLERFGEVMNKLQNKEELQERLRRSIEGEAQDETQSQIQNENQIERRAMRAEILEELKEKVPEVKTQVQQIMRERVQLFRELEAKREEIRENRQEFREGLKQEIQGNKEELKQSPEARQELRQETIEKRKEVRDENQEIRKEIQQERQEFRQEVKDQVKERTENTGTENKIEPMPKPNLEGNPLPPLPESENGNEPG